MRRLSAGYRRLSSAASLRYTLLMARLISLLVLIALVRPVAWADGIPAHLPEDVRTVAAESLIDERLTQMARTCPDVLWRERSLNFDLFSGDCEGVRSCRRQCTWGSGEACFDLARIMQDLEPGMPATVSERWFARSCAMGYEGGCTNRAAGILIRASDDPFTALPREEAAECAARTFALSCAAEDAWGCTMHARDLRDGVLDEPDPEAARAAARKACALEGSPPVGACDAAKRWVLNQ